MHYTVSDTPLDYFLYQIIDNSLNNSNEIMLKTTNQYYELENHPLRSKVHF